MPVIVQSDTVTITTGPVDPVNVNIDSEEGTNLSIVGVPGEQGPPGDQRVFVGVQPPPNPRLYDVWIDIS